VALSAAALVQGVRLVSSSAHSAAGGQLRQAALWTTTRCQTPQDAAARCCAARRTPAAQRVRAAAATPRGAAEAPCASPCCETLRRCHCRCRCRTRCAGRCVLYAHRGRHCLPGRHHPDGVPGRRRPADVLRPAAAPDCATRGALAALALGARLTRRGAGAGCWRGRGPARGVLRVAGRCGRGPQRPRHAARHAHAARVAGAGAGWPPHAGAAAARRRGRAARSRSRPRPCPGQVWRTPHAPATLRPALSSLPPHFAAAAGFHLGVHPTLVDLHHLAELRAAAEASPGAAAAPRGGLLSIEPFTSADAPLVRAADVGRLPLCSRSEAARASDLARRQRSSCVCFALRHTSCRPTKLRRCPWRAPAACGCFVARAHRCADCVGAPRSGAGGRCAAARARGAPGRSGRAGGGAAARAGGRHRAQARAAAVQRARTRQRTTWLTRGCGPHAHAMPFAPPLQS
jgi:hypothetical protein